MKVYIEFVYLLNFLLDFMILYGTKRLLKINKNISRLLLSSVFGMMITLLVNVQISNIELFLIKIIFSLIMIVISFGYKNILKNTFYFYIISIIIGGIIYLLNIKLNFYMNILLLLFLTPIIIYILIKEINNYKLDIKDKYLVTIKYNQKTYKLEGFIDTGNKLKSPISKKGIILVNIKINPIKTIYVPYKALNTEGIIPCIKPDKVMIGNIEIKNYLIGIAKEKFNLKDYNCILPNKLKEELI